METSLLIFVSRTYVKRLEGEDRVVEIAQMIDGNQITQTRMALDPTSIACKRFYLA
ncbi:MAG: hypothetical protein ACJ0PV_03245 [Flavobacteriaceae bacterium]